MSERLVTRTSASSGAHSVSSSSVPPDPGRDRDPAASLCQGETTARVWVCMDAAGCRLRRRRPRRRYMAQVELRFDEGAVLEGR